LEKQFVSRTSTYAGIIIVVKPLFSTADTSIHCDFEGDSKATDESGLKLEKHAIQSTSIDAGIMIAVKLLLSTADASIRRKVKFDSYSDE
jgi:hypothetical protein